MKKHIALILSASVLLTACQNTPETSVSYETEEISSPSSDVQTAEPASSDASAATTAATPAADKPTEESAPPQSENPDKLWQGELPAMDGSTSAIPLETGIKAHLLGITWEEAGELVEHHKTHISFGNLLDGTADLIFSVPISDEQKALAEEQDVSLTFTPVAKEGFVFCVNANNPVDSITMEQLRDIYSGRITNWKELGGEDEPIKPFQRNKSSGSQNYMTEFMGDIPLSEAPSEYILGEMGSILDMVSSYDNGKGSIGYSVYSYAAQMYADANKIKLIAVDGVKPTKQTMADGSYPLSSCTYIISTDKADENTRKFIEWAASDEGQRCVLECGYLPVNGMEIPAEYLPYEAVGTGMKKPADYSPSEKMQNCYISYPINVLADKEFEARINAEVGEALDKLNAKYPDGVDDVNWCYAQNGYLQILAGAPEFYDMLPREYSDCYTFVYDIIEKKRIEKYSDLFYEGENFVPLVNSIVRAEANAYTDWSKRQKADFAGLTGEPDCFGLTYTILNKGNIYFPGMFYVPFGNTAESEIIKDMMIPYTYRDMSACFADPSESRDVVSPEYFATYADIDGKPYYGITYSRFMSDDEIARQNDLWKNAQDAYYEHLAKMPEEYYRGGIPRLSVLNDNYIMLNTEVAAWEPNFAYYDVSKGRLVNPEDILGEDWESLLPSDTEYSYAWVANIASWDNKVWIYGNVGGEVKELGQIDVSEEIIERFSYQR